MSNLSISQLPSEATPTLANIILPAVDTSNDSNVSIPATALAGQAGQTGATGPAPTLSGVNVTMLDSGASATGSFVSSGGTIVLDLGIPADSSSSGSTISLSGNNLGAVILDPSVFIENNGVLTLATTSFGSLSTIGSLTSATELLVVSSSGSAYSTTLGAIALEIATLNAPSIAISNISNQYVGNSFVITGTLTNYFNPPILSYEDNSGGFVSLPSPTITNTAFGFTHPAPSSTGSLVISVRDGNGVLGVSDSFTVSYATATAATLSGVPGADVAGTSVSGTVALTPSYAQAYAVLSTGGVEQGARTAFVGSSLPSLAPSGAGTYLYEVLAASSGGSPLASSSITVTATPSTAATTPANVPATSNGGVAITGCTTTLTPGGSTAYAVLNNGSDIGTRQAFSGTAIPSLTPPVGDAGTLTIKIYNSATAGTLLATSANITNTDIATAATLVGAPTSAYKSTAITGVTTVRTPTDATVYAALLLAGTLEGSRISFASNTVPSLTPANTGSYQIALYSASSGGTALVTSSSFPVTILATAATISAPSTGTSGVAITTATDTLTPAGATGYACLYTGGADVGTRIAFTSTTIPSLTPASAGSFNIKIYAALTGGTALATSGTITVSAAVVAPPNIATSVAPNLILDASKANVLYADQAFTTPQTTNGGAVLGFKDSSTNAYNFSGTSGNLFTLVTAAKNGLNGVSYGTGPTYATGFTGPTAFATAIKNIVQGSTGAVTISAAVITASNYNATVMSVNGNTSDISSEAGQYPQIDYNSTHTFGSASIGYQRNVYVFNAAAGTLSISYNGGAFNTVAYSVTADASTWVPFLGNANNNNNGLIVLEIDVYPAAASTSDVTAINSYFTTKFGS